MADYRATDHAKPGRSGCPTICQCVDNTTPVGADHGSACTLDPLGLVTCTYTSTRASFASMHHIATFGDLHVLSAAWLAAWAAIVLVPAMQDVRFNGSCVVSYGNALTQPKQVNHGGHHLCLRVRPASCLQHLCIITGRTWQGLGDVESRQATMPLLHCLPGIFS